MENLLIILIVAVLAVFIYLLQKSHKDYKYLHDNYTKLKNTIKEEVTRNNTLAEQIKNINQQADARVAAEVKVQMLSWTKNEAKAIRTDAKKRATSADLGSLGENFTPLLTELNPKDYRHMGDPVDFIYYEHYDAVRRREKDEVGRIIFIDTKTGKGQLTTGQRRIRDAIVAGRVYFAVFTPGKGIRYWPEEKQNG